MPGEVAIRERLASWWRSGDTPPRRLPATIAVQVAYFVAFVAGYDLAVVILGERGEPIYAVVTMAALVWTQRKLGISRLPLRHGSVAQLLVLATGALVLPGTVGYVLTFLVLIVTAGVTVLISSDPAPLTVIVSDISPTSSEAFSEVGMAS